MVSIRLGAAQEKAKRLSSSHLRGQDILFTAEAAICPLGSLSHSKLHRRALQSWEGVNIVAVAEAAHQDWTLEVTRFGRGRISCNEAQEGLCYKRPGKS